METAQRKALPVCPVETALEVIGDKWKVLILRELLRGTRRFNELRRNLTGVTQKMLTQQLRALETDGIVSRTVYPQVPPKVEYRLTELGQTLRPLVHQLADWGGQYKQQLTGEPWMGTGRYFDADLDAASRPTPQSGR